MSPTILRAIGASACCLSIWIRKVAPPDRVPTTEDQQPDYTIDELQDLRGLDLFL